MDGARRMGKFLWSSAVVYLSCFAIGNRELRFSDSAVGGILPVSINGRAAGRGSEASKNQKLSKFLISTIASVVHNLQRSLLARPAETIVLSQSVLEEAIQNVRTRRRLAGWLAVLKD